MIPVPQALSVWELLPGCILASPGPSSHRNLLKTLTQGYQTLSSSFLSFSSFLFSFPPPSLPSSLPSFLLSFFSLSVMVPSHLCRAPGLTRAALPQLQGAPSSPKGA